MKPNLVKKEALILSTQLPSGLPCQPKGELEFPSRHTGALVSYLGSFQVTPAVDFLFNQLEQYDWER
jgi:hypothetical protein